MMVDKKTATNAAGNGVIAPSVVAAAEQVIIEYRSIDGFKTIPITRGPTPTSKFSGSQPASRSSALSCRSW